uniref:Sc:d0202 n=1 Tax=Astyanax mexicanus TaxID=7994 RepID=A0A3B1ICF2_ASTMX
MVLMDLGLRVLWTGALLSVVSVAVVITPPKVVVEYGGPTSAVCTTNLTHMGLGWEAPQGPVEAKADVQSLTWTVDSLTEWDISPYCYLTKTNHDQEIEKLQVLVYKVPDKVSLSLVQKSSGPLVEGNIIELHCRVENAAPVKDMMIAWFKGKDKVKTDQFFRDTTITPKNESRNMTFIVNRSHNGLEYRCEALLLLGPEGPQPPPTKTSETLRLNIYYVPKFLKEVEMFQQMKEEEGMVLNCTVEGNPPPSYSWTPPIEGQNTRSVVTVKTAGNYTCRASNPHGSHQKLFIISPAPIRLQDRTTFWAILGVGLVLVVVLVAGYLVKKKMSSLSVV